MAGMKHLLDRIDQQQKRIVIDPGSLLYNRCKAYQEEIAQLRTENEQLRERVARLEKMPRVHVLCFESGGSAGVEMIRAYRDETKADTEAEKENKKYSISSPYYVVELEVTE